MAEEERRPGEEEAGGPGDAFQVFLTMEELVEKLKLLKYQESFCRQLGFKPVSRHYFALPTNSGEQFHNFTSLAAWLLQMSGKQFEMPQEYDDPNSTIASILDNVRNFGHSINFPPNKLKSGSGEHCVWVLDRLSDEALKAKNFKWKIPVYPEEELDEENIVEDDSELTIQQAERDMQEDLMADDDDFEEEEHIMGLEDLRKLGFKKGQDSESVKPESVLESTTDASDWRLEVERVLPQLKVLLRPENKDWRVHVEQMHQQTKGIDSALKDTSTQLLKVHEDVGRILDKISSREKYLNKQLDHLLQQFRALQDSLAETKEKYRQGSGGVTEKTRLLAQFSEELERIKQEMEERGSSMTDGAPLVKIKQAIAKLKNEIVNMDIRIGVCNYTLLQGKLREKSEQNRALALGYNDYDMTSY